MLSCFSNSNLPIHFLQQGTIEKAFLTCHAPEHTRNKWGNNWIQKLYIAYTGTANHWQIVRSFAGRNWFRVCNVLAKTWGPLIPILLLSQWTNVIVKDLETYFINLSVGGEDISKLSMYSATTWCLPVLCTWSSSSFFSLHLLIENVVNVQPGNGVLRYLNDSIAPWLLTHTFLIGGSSKSIWTDNVIVIVLPIFPKRFFCPRDFDARMEALEAIKTRMGGRVGASESWGHQRPNIELSWRTRGLVCVPWPVGRPCNNSLVLSFGRMGTRSNVPMKAKVLYYLFILSHI